MILLIVFCFCIVQAVCYILCAKFKAIRWVDLVLFPVFIFLIIWVFPEVFLPEHEPGSDCMFSASSMGRILFVVFGIPSSVVIFVVNCYLRRGEKWES